jgi:DNA-binding SARP family transcriptional activator
MIRFIALGAPDLQGDSAPEAGSALSQPRVLALLTYLAVARPRGFHRRDKLVALFWPELDHEGARNALRQLVHRLRRAIGDETVAGRGADEIGLDPSRIECDVVAFESALDAGRHAEALERFSGELLPGFFIADAP